VVPSEPAETAAEADAEAVRRARIDGWVREEHAAGNPSRALEIAIDENAPESLRWLIEQGVSPETPIRVRGDGHQIPLVEASRLGHLETVRSLLEAGADPNAVEPPEPPLASARTALGEALRNGNCAVAELLEAMGARHPETLETNRCP
jgi:ankyrin repeat protein